MAEKTTKEEKVYKPFNKDDIKKKLDLIVDQFHIQKGSQDVVTEIVNELNKTYGLKKPTIRSAARIIFKNEKDETNVKFDELSMLVDLF